MQALAEQYSQLTESLKVNNQAAKALREEREVISDIIMKEMIKSKITSFQMPDNRELVMLNSVRLGTITPELICDGLREYFRNNSSKNPVPTEISDFIVGARDSNENLSLKLKKSKN